MYIYISVLISIILLFFTIPSATHFYKKEINKLVPSNIEIDPCLDYRGYWKYTTVFEVYPNNDSPLITDFHRKVLLDCFNNKVEKGVSEWILTKTFNLVVNPAEGQLGTISMSWKTDPIVFNKHKVRWLFETKINWNDERILLPNIIYGREEYEVKKRDRYNRPIILKGTILGCIQPENHFSIKAKSTFIKITEEEYNNLKDKITEKVCRIKTGKKRNSFDISPNRSSETK